MKRQSLVATKTSALLSLNDLENLEGVILERKYQILKKIGKGA